MDRRKFLINGTLALGAVGLSRNLFAGQFKMPAFGDTKSISEDRILVMIRLGGGNDGLNTVIPYDQYDNLVVQRPSLVIPEPDLLDLSGIDLKLHPSMTEMQQIFDNGQLSIIQSVGANAGGSHFRSMDIWESGILSGNNPKEIPDGWVEF